jgi:hypothetical protein
MVARRTDASGLRSPSLRTSIKGVVARFATCGFWGSGPYGAGHTSHGGCCSYQLSLRFRGGEAQDPAFGTWVGRGTNRDVSRRDLICHQGCHCTRVYRQDNIWLRSARIAPYLNLTFRPDPAASRAAGGAHGMANQGQTEVMDNSVTVSVLRSIRREH